MTVRSECVWRRTAVASMALAFAAMCFGCTGARSTRVVASAPAHLSDASVFLPASTQALLAERASAFGHASPEYARRDGLVGAP